MGLKIDWRLIVLAIILGIFVGLATGLVEGTTSAGSSERQFGFPLIWRFIDTSTNVISFDITGFLVDWVFGIVITSFMIFVAIRTEKWMLKKSPPRTKKQIQRSEREGKRKQK